MNESVEATYWIVHRESRVRAALARIAGAGDNTVLGSPSDDLFASASRPDIVLLAVSSDFELELEFAHRVATRTVGARWIVLAEARDLPEARRLFDNLPARFLVYPPKPDVLRREIAALTGERPVESLSRRDAREGLSARFNRWFIGLDQPDLFRSLDPNLGHLPLLVRGEVGTGRGVVARYVHAFGSDDANELIHVPCRGIAGEGNLLALLEADARVSSSAKGAWRRTIWLEDVDHLPLALQMRIRDWIEYGLPGGSLRARELRFIATAGDPEGVTSTDDLDAPGLAPALATSLSGLVIELPPLRERASDIERFVDEAAHAWAQERGETQRSFGKHALRELANYPWPGNMAQLEAAVFRTLSHTRANPVEPHHLKIQHESMPLTDDALPEAEIVEETREPPVAKVLDEMLASDPVPEPEPRLETQIIEEPEASEPEDERPTAPPWAQPSAPVRESEPREPSPEPPPAEPVGEDAYRRLVGAVAHEVRNPLTSIRTFSELLPDHHDDEEFRNRFAELVGADVRQIEGVVDRLERLANVRGSRREVVDLSALLDRVLERQTATIQDRHLLVLKELERNQGQVVGDPDAFDGAFAGLFETAFSMVPERGDVYIASRYNALGLDGKASVRVLLRYHNPNAGPPLSDILSEAPETPEGLSPAETSLEYLICESIIRAQGGAMTIDTTSAQETVIVVDLPAAEASRG